MARAPKIQRALVFAGAGLISAALEPVAHAAPVDFDLAAGVPRVAFTSTGAELTRAVTATAETSLLRVDASSTLCVQAMLPAASAFGGRMTCASGETGGPGAGVAAQTGALALKLPRVPIADTRVEVSLVAWRSAVGAASIRGTDAMVQVTQSWRGLDVGIGHSEPVHHGEDGGWRSTWVMTGVKFSPQARLQLVSERSAEVITGVRDTRVTASVSYALFDGMRGNLYVTRIADDPVRPWLAGAGIVWAF